jgi:hypothetical protein
MPIDFTSLVLVPCQDIFSVPFAIDPITSRPGAPPYSARGVFSSGAVDVMGQDGSVLSDVRTTLGIRLAEFTIPPMARDKITLSDASIDPGHRGAYYIDDTDPDGQGGAVLTLRRQEPEPL